ncbi:MAG TPA: phosphotransferase, partial [Spongiibacteraceae bacterium]|nr:phosphotransferase [Spongiibacteraceae bacterium]
KKQVDAGQTRALPLLADLHRRLAARIPTEQGRPGLVHGDYRFDNVVLGADCALVAVLDWELCTIGEPVADFVWSLCYWADPGDALHFLPDPPTCGAQFMRRDAVAELYAARSGFDLSDIDYYTAFSWWKMACIVEGVYGRMLRGAGGGMKTGPLEQVATMVERYLAQADDLLGE